MHRETKTYYIKTNPVDNTVIPSYNWSKSDFLPKLVKEIPYASDYDVIKLAGIKTFNRILDDRVEGHYGYRLQRMLTINKERIKNIELNKQIEKENEERKKNHKRLYSLRPIDYDFYTDETIEKAREDLKYYRKLYSTALNFNDYKIKTTTLITDEW